MTTRENATDTTPAGTTADADSPKFAIPGYKDEAEFMAEVRERFSLAEAHWGPQYRAAEKAVEFTFFPDKQWDEWMSRARGNRPKMTFNKVRQAVKQVTNDQRQNRPQPKVRGANEKGRQRAEIHEGLFRGIERLSNADRAYDTSFQYAVAGGFGVWRIVTDYVDDWAFEQDIIIREIENPFAVLFDPSAKMKDRRDGRFLFFKDTMPRSVFKKQYPGKDLSDFDSMPWATEWQNANEVVVCEYWFKVKQKKTILRMSDERVVDLKDVELILDELAEKGITEVERREIEVDQVRQCLLSGCGILEGPSDWAGKFIPFVPVWGDILNVRGKDYFFGMTAFAMDAQRAYNFERSVFMETIAKQPKSPLMATPAMVEGFEETYESLGTNDPPVLLYNVDPSAPQARPTREPPPAFPAALANAAQISNDDIKATTGKYDASLGAKSNETSGRAILARAREGDVASFDYIDNLAYAQKFSYEIIDDLIPHIYDTPRQVTIIGPDEKEKVVELNQPVFDDESGQWVEMNDFEGARYSIGVTVGPSFTTQRLETADAMMQLSNDPSPIGALAKYQFLKSLDTPGMDELLAGARRFLVSSGVLEPEDQDGPPPAPPGPNPKDVADALEKQSQAHLNTVKAAQIEQDMHRQVAVDQISLAHAGAVPGAMTPTPPPMPAGPGPMDAQMGPPVAPLGGPVAPPVGMPQDSLTAPGGFPG